MHAHSAALYWVREQAARAWRQWRAVTSARLAALRQLGACVARLSRQGLSKATCAWKEFAAERAVAVAALKHAAAAMLHREVPERPPNHHSLPPNQAILHHSLPPNQDAPPQRL